MPGGGNRLAGTVALMLVGAVSLGACGNETPSVSDARETTAEFLQLYADYDPELCERSSSERQALVALGADGTGVSGETCEEVVEELQDGLADGLFGADVIRAAADDIDVAEVRIGDGVALVTFPELEEPFGPVALVAEDGDWRVADVTHGSG